MTGYIIIGTILFSVGLYGVLTRKDMLRIFISVEIMAASVVMILASIMTFKSSPGVSSSGFVFLFFVWLFSIANAAVGLPLFLLIRNKLKTQSTEDLKQLSG